MHKTAKALILMSGGLDSLLAAKVILNQGVHVEAVNYLIGFNCSDAAIVGAQKLGIKLHVFDVVAEYKDVLIKPKHGYGANLNPCLDCKVFMVKQAVKFLREKQFDFIITGEVVGQRPKSQRIDTMPIIAKESGAQDLLLRPLSAKLLPETFAEREKLVNRDLLYAFSGRSRKPQIELAKELDLVDYPQPSGGCLLTDENYCARLTDLWNAQETKNYCSDDLELLKIGRHLRLKTSLKVIIGRDESENIILEKYVNRFPHLISTSHNGPMVLFVDECTQENIELAARLLARFSAGRNENLVTVKFNSLDGSTEVFKVEPMHINEVLKEWYI